MTVYLSPADIARELGVSKSKAHELVKQMIHLRDGRTVRVSRASPASDSLDDLFPGTGVVGRAWGELARLSGKRKVAQLHRGGDQCAASVLALVGTAHPADQMDDQEPRLSP